MSEIEDFGGPINRPAQNARQGTPGELENAANAFGEGATDFLGLNESLPQGGPMPFTLRDAPATEPTAEGDSWLFDASNEAPLSSPAPLVSPPVQAPAPILNTTWSEPAPRRSGRWVGVAIGAASLCALALVGYPALRRSAGPEPLPATVTRSQPAQRSDAAAPLEVVSRRAAIDDLDTPGAVEPAPEIDAPELELGAGRISASPREPDVVVPTNALEENGLVEVVDPTAATNDDGSESATTLADPEPTGAAAAARRGKRARAELLLAREAALESARLEQSLALAAMNADCEPDPASSAIGDVTTELSPGTTTEQVASDNAESDLAALVSWSTGSDSSTEATLDDARVELDTSVETEARRARRAEARAERWKAREAALEAARIEQAELLAAMNSDCEPELVAATTDAAPETAVEPTPEPELDSQPTEADGTPATTTDVTSDATNTTANETAVATTNGATTDNATSAATSDVNDATANDATNEATNEPALESSAESMPVDALVEPDAAADADAEARRARRAAARAARWKAREAALEAARLEQAEALATMNADCEPEPLAQPVATVEPEPALTPVTPSAPAAPTLIGAPAPANLPVDAPPCGPQADPATLGTTEPTPALDPSQCSGNPRITQLATQDVLLLNRPRPTARTATQEELKTVWTETAIPLDSIGRATKLLTPNVGKVRATLTSGELFEGQLYAVGEGCVWLDTSYGRMGLTGARIKSVVRTEPPKDAVNPDPTGTVVDARVRIRTPGGMLTGRLLEDDGKSATVLTESGARLTVESSMVERLAEEPRVRVQSREKP